VAADRDRIWHRDPVRTRPDRRRSSDPQPHPRSRLGSLLDPIVPVAAQRAVTGVVRRLPTKSTRHPHCSAQGSGEATPGCTSDRECRMKAATPRGDEPSTAAARAGTTRRPRTPAARRRSPPSPSRRSAQRAPTRDSAPATHQTGSWGPRAPGHQDDARPIARAHECVLRPRGRVKKSHGLRRRSSPSTSSVHSPEITRTASCADSPW
jgi:hypothetical protein